MPSSAAQESLFARIFITPLLFFSFLVSLLLIDKDTYSKVFSGHGSYDQHYHTHQRKMARREIEDAFHLRNRVLAAIFVITGFGFALAGWSGVKVVQMLFPGISRSSAN